MKSIRLPSGAELKIQLAPFEDGRDLYQAVLEELRSLKLHGDIDVDTNLYKDIFCVGFASKKIEALVWKCLARATYNGERISRDTFEPEEARGDYMEVCFTVMVENVSPFTKGLSVRLKGFTEKLKNFLT